MTGNKPSNVIEALTRAPAIAGDGGWSALCDAMRASFKHAVIGVGGTGSQVGEQLARVHVDICMMVAFDDAKFITGSGRTGGVIVLSDFHVDKLASPEPDFPVWIDNEPVWTACTKMMGHRVERHRSEPLERIGEPLTLKLLFDAVDTDAATTLAQLFYARFERWNDRSEPLREAMSAISRMLVDVSAYSSKRSKAYRYRAAKVLKGWASREVDSIYCRSFLAAHHERVGVSRPTSDFWLRQVEASWRGAHCLLEPIKLGALEAPGDVIGDGDDGGVTDDFVSGERLMALYFGKRRRRR
jgi:hypothetical protein